MSTYVFAAIMGFLWLSTIPLANGIVAQIFGVKYLTMLSGLVFFSHQLGSFCGAFLGGYLFDRTLLFSRLANCNYTERFCILSELTR